MGQIRPWEDNSLSASQEIPWNLGKPKTQYADPSGRAF